MSSPLSLSVFRRIVPRDRALLSLFAEHYLLSTPQIAAAFFDTLRTAQRRLTALHRLDVVHRFAYPNAANTAVPYLYTLGPVGLALYPDAYHDPDGRYTRAPRTSLERARRIAASTTAEHLLGVNQFFIDLLAAARSPVTHLRHGDAAVTAAVTAAGAVDVASHAVDGALGSVPARARLVRWWSEQHATDVYGQSGVRPDGHGIWHVAESDAADPDAADPDAADPDAADPDAADPDAAHPGGRTVGFFLEHDRGTENLPRVVAKLRSYARLTEFGPRYPVLLWLPSPEREANILRLLNGVPTPMPVATAVHGSNPAGRVWTLASDLPTSPRRRRRLDELPSDHGPHSGTNPGRYDP